jgi:GntR family transcriptional repressor for pyruvate dehydrogenase complex
MGALFKPLHNKRAFEGVSGSIKRLVFKGILKPGDRLPSESELARQFGVGRQTIREALRVLELSGFIDVQRGGAGGPTIKNTILATVSQSLADAFQMESITIEELTFARSEIERCVLRSAIKNVESKDIEALQANVSEAKAKIAAGIEAFGENIEFHRLLAKCSKNPVFVIVMESIMAVVTDFLSRLKPSRKNSNLVVKSHEELIEAIIQRDTELALGLLEEHLLSVKGWLHKSYGQGTDFKMARV